MKNKLLLNEDEDIMVVEPVKQDVVEPKIEQEADVDILSTSNLINQMIKGEWDAIDLYNAVVVTIKGNENAKNKEEVIDTINDIVNEEYIHVGQLEKLLQLINGDANSINDGEAEASNDLAGKEIEG